MFFAYRVERDEFLVYEPAMSVEPSLGYKYMDMGIKAQTPRKWMQHNNGTSRQSSVSVLV